MADDKNFITYNQQMRKLRNDKHIDCSGSKDKKILIRMGYFNIVNGYKNPFVSGQDNSGKHSYISGTSIDQLQAVKNSMNSYVPFYCGTSPKSRKKHEHWPVISLMNATTTEIFLGTVQMPIHQTNLYKRKCQ